MWKLLALGIGIAAIVLFGFSLISVDSGSDVSASAVLVDLGSDASGFARADSPRDWQFPQDFGAHPDFQTEWWYYTGNLHMEDGRRFGYQFTIFRRGLTPESADTASEWRSNQLYMVHFTVTDVAGDQFYHAERFSRSGAGLAGAEIDPQYRVWLEGWQVAGLNADASQTRITAATDQVAVDLTLDQLKPPALQGDQGLSSKSVDTDSASYYYSLTRLQTDGTITIGGEIFAVSGFSWKDHEFSTNALDADARGWDWFGLQLDDNRELMLGKMRYIADKPPGFGGLLVNADGSTQYLTPDLFTIESISSWMSPYTGATYPSGWNIIVNTGDADPLHLTLTPQIADQELHGGGIAYWEGSVRITGDATGYGYVELTGYIDALTSRF